MTLPGLLVRLPFRKAPPLGAASGFFSGVGGGGASATCLLAGLGSCRGGDSVTGFVGGGLGAVAVCGAGEEGGVVLGATVGGWLRVAGRGAGVESLRGGTAVELLRGAGAVS